METKGDSIIEGNKLDAVPFVLDVQEAITGDIFNESTKKMTEEAQETVANEIFSKPATNPTEELFEDQKQKMDKDGQVECKIDDSDKTTVNKDDIDNKESAKNEDIKSELAEVSNTILDFNSTSAKTAIVSSTPKSKAKRNSKDERHLWIYNINPATTAGQLKLDLSKYGRVILAKIVTNGDRYFGYALMERAEFVKICVEKLNNKVMDGFLLEVSADAPNKRTVDVYKKEIKKNKEKRITPRKSRKRSRSHDPLTLKVRSGRYRSVRSESRSRRRQREREEKAALYKKQRELELVIENEKRKLESEKRKLEREKLELLKLQRKLREDRENERRREEQRKKEFTRKRSRSLSRRRVNLEPRRKRSSTPNIKPRDYRTDYKKNRSGSLTRSKPTHKFDVPPPPPPRLTSEDKAEHWKFTSDSKKVSRGYYGLEKDRVYQQTDYGERKRFKESSYEKKYPEDEKRKRYENKQPSCRSEVYLASSRTGDQFLNKAEVVPGRFESLVYPMQQSRAYIPSNTTFQNVSHSNVPQMPNWNRPNYANTPAKPFPYEHDRYEQYDKRPSYFISSRKY